MKSSKSILIVLFLCIAGLQSVDAQWGTSYFTDFYYPSWNNPYYYNRKEIGIKEKHIQSQILIEERYKKGKPFHRKINQIKRFDQNGNEVEFTYGRRNGKIIYRTISSYDTSNNRIRLTSFNRKKQLSDELATYDRFKHCILFIHYNSKGKIKRKMEHDWDSKRELESRSYKNGKDLKYKWVFEYYPDSTIKKTTKYNASGKIKKVWTYDCNLLGETVKKHQDTVKMCHFDSTDSQGFYYTIFKTSKENGKMYKTVNKFSKDSLYLGYRYYNEKNRLISLSDVNYSGDTIISTYKSYNKKGKIMHNSLYKQDKKRNNFYSEHCWKGKKCDKKKYVSKYVYDSKGILLKITTWHGSEISTVWDYFYTFY